MKHSKSSKDKTGDLKKNQNVEEYFFELFERYQDPIFRFLYFRLSDRAVALDITQDTFAKTWIYLANGKVIDHEEAFLYRAAKNTLIDYFKKTKSFSLDSMIEAGFDPKTDKVVDEITKGDDIVTIQSLVSDLDEESKQIIYLRFGEERPIEEIAKIFGKSANAMTVQIHRIVKKLRGRFTDTQTYGT